MGSMQARETDAAVRRQELHTRAALVWHLESNHYPPLPLALLPVAEAAIEAGNIGDWEREIPMPAGIQFRYRDTVTAAEAIESMHLNDFIESDEAWDSDY